MSQQQDAPPAQLMPGLTLRGYALSAGAGLFGPAGAWLVNPAFGMVCTGVAAFMAVLILLTRLFGNKEYSKRAADLLDLLFGRATPQPDGQGGDRVESGGSSTDSQ